MRRREFIGQSLAVAGALPALSSAFASPAWPDVSRGLHVLIDTRLPESRRYGELAASRGARISRYQGDLTALWQRSLLAQWRAGRGSMAGISTERGWFCISQLASEHRWKASARRLKTSGLYEWSLTPGEHA